MLYTLELTADSTTYQLNKEYKGKIRAYVVLEYYRRDFSFEMERIYITMKKMEQTTFQLNNLFRRNCLPTLH